MGVCTSANKSMSPEEQAELRAETVANKKITDDLARMQHKENENIKMLLLGTGDSGKTTLRKQLTNCYGGGFNDSMRGKYANIVVNNIVEGFKMTIRTAEELNLEWSSTAKPCAMKIEALGAPLSVDMSSQYVEAFKILYEDPVFAKCMEKRSILGIYDNFPAFAQKFHDDKIWGKSGQWIPSVEECVMARVRTSGVVEDAFSIDGVKFKLFDAGGQRSERRKWINCFDNVNTVIFVASLSEYDMTLFEDSKKNRLEESLELFNETVNSHHFVDSSFLLFLNKRDVFEDKFLKQGIPLNISGQFPGAPEGKDLEAAIEFIKGKFIKQKRDKKSLVVYVTTATNPKNVKAVFLAAKEYIFKRNLELSNFSVD